MQIKDKCWLVDSGNGSTLCSSLIPPKMKSTDNKEAIVHYLGGTQKSKNAIWN